MYIGISEDLKSSYLEFCLKTRLNVWHFLKKKERKKERKRETFLDHFYLRI